MCPADLEVFVLSAPGRDRAHELCFASIETSEVGHDYTVCENPTGVSPAEHWHATMQRAACAASSLVLVTEDDVLFNRHLVHNVLTWKWPYNPQFGAGWLYSPGGYRHGKDCWYDRHLVDWYGSLGVLYRTEHLAAITERSWQLFQERYAPSSWDCAIAASVHQLGRGIRQHGPPLIEHLWQLPSTWGYPQEYTHRSTRGTFKLDWHRSLTDAQRR